MGGKASRPLTVCTDTKSDMTRLFLKNITEIASGQTNSSYVLWAPRQNAWLCPGSSFCFFLLQTARFESFALLQTDRQTCTVVYLWRKQSDGVLLCLTCSNWAGRIAGRPTGHIIYKHAHTHTHTHTHTLTNIYTQTHSEAYIQYTICKQGTQAYWHMGADVHVNKQYRTMYTSTHAV